jgi:hypothetical protein
MSVVLIFFAFLPMVSPILCIRVGCRVGDFKLFAKSVACWFRKRHSKQVVLLPWELWRRAKSAVLEVF